MSLDEDQILSVRTVLLEAEVRQHADEIVMATCVSVYENMLARVLGRVPECRLEEQLADLPAPHCLPNLEGTELQRRSVQPGAFVIDDLVRLHSVDADRRQIDATIPVHPRHAAF